MISVMYDVLELLGFHTLKILRPMRLSLREVKEYHGELNTIYEGLFDDLSVVLVLHI